MQLEIDKVVTSSVQLGMERVTQRLLEEARVAMEELRMDAMRRKLEPVFGNGVGSGSVTRAVSSATRVAVAEILRQQQLELARLRQEEYDRQVQANKVTVASECTRGREESADAPKSKRPFGRACSVGGGADGGLVTSHCACMHRAASRGMGRGVGLKPYRAMVEEDREEERRKAGCFGCSQSS